MEIQNLQLLLKENNDSLLDFLKNEYIHSLKDLLLNDIKKEISKLFINKEYDKGKIKVCGFSRTRKRGNCKRITRYVLCPYHLEKAIKEHEKTVLPDKNSSGILSGFSNVSLNDKKNKNERIQPNDEYLDVNKPYYTEYINYLNNVYYNYDEIVYKNYLFEEEVKIFEKIDTDIFNYVLPLCKNKEIVNFNSNNENISLLSDNTDLTNKKKKKKNKKNKKKKPKTLEKKYEIFNDKVRNLIRSNNYVLNEDKEKIVKIININLNKYINKHIDLYSCGYNIFDELYEYIHKNKHKYKNEAILPNIHKHIILYYKIFSEYIESKEEKWLIKIDNLIENTLKDF